MDPMLKLLIDTFIANKGFNAMLKEVEKLTVQFPILIGNEEIVAGQMSNTYCLGFFDALLGKEVCDKNTTNVDVSNLDSFINLLSNICYCTGLNDGIISKKNEEEFLYNVRQQVIDIFNSPVFLKKHIHSTGIDPTTDFTKYEPLQHKHFTKIQNKYNEPSYNKINTSTSTSTCNCSDDTFINSLNSLTSTTCPNLVIPATNGYPSIYFGMNSLFSVCPNIPCDTSDNAPYGCVAQCPLQSGCGSAVNRAVTYMYPQNVTIPSTPPGLTPITYGVSFSYFNPLSLGQNCNYVANYPDSSNETYKFASCMLSICFTPYNAIPGQMSSCQCYINSNIDQVPWMTITNEPVPDTTIMSGATQSSNTYTATLWANNIGITLPTNYSNYGSCN